MKSKTEKALVIILSVIIVIIAYKIIDPKVKNVFDEMYYGEKKYIVGLEKHHFGTYREYIDGTEMI